MNYPVKCGWCKSTKDQPGWHDCPEAVEGRKQLGDALVRIHELMAGGQENWESVEDEARRKFTKATFDKLGD